MQQHRIISMLSILVMLIIPVIGWFLVAQPQLAVAGQADDQRADMESQIAASTALVAQLKADNARLPELNDDLNTLRTSIPAKVDSSGYIDGLDALAKIAHVSITSLTVGTPVAYVPAQVAEGDESDVDPADELPPAVVTDPLVTSENFVTVAVTVGVTGGWSDILKFVDGLQSSPRLFLITELSTATLDGTGSALSGSISGFIFAVPTGVEGKPRPISTTVKYMDGPDPTQVSEEPDEDTAPTPGATDTPEP